MLSGLLLAKPICSLVHLSDVFYRVDKGAAPSYSYTILWLRLDAYLALAGVNPNGPWAFSNQKCTDIHLIVITGFNYVLKIP